MASFLEIVACSLVERQKQNTWARAIFFGGIRVANPRDNFILFKHSVVLANVAELMVRGLQCRQGGVVSSIESICENDDFGMWIRGLDGTNNVKQGRVTSRRRRSYTEAIR